MIAIAKKEFDDIKINQEKNVIGVAAALTQLLRKDAETRQDILEDAEQLHYIRDDIVMVRAAIAENKKTFMKHNYKELVWFCNKEMGVLGDLLVVFGKKPIDETDLKIIKKLNTRLLKYVVKLLDRLPKVKVGIQ